jgi:hypothetical protein
MQYINCEVGDESIRQSLTAYIDFVIERNK